MYMPLRGAINSKQKPGNESNELQAKVEAMRHEPNYISGIEEH